MNIERYGRNWAVYDNAGNLICVTVYKKGAVEVINRLSGEEPKSLVQPHLNKKEVANLQKEIKQLSKKFNNILQQI